VTIDNLENYIDHSLLAPAADLAAVERWCAEATRYRFAGVCVLPTWVKAAAELLHGTPQKTICAIAYPTGSTTAAGKLYEAQEAVENGANELDVAIAYGAVKMGKIDWVHRELGAIVEAVGVPVRPIVEFGLLSQDEIKEVVEAALDAGVKGIKTHTGWYGGVGIADIRFLRELLPEGMEIKASGGIGDRQFALDAIEAGATRLGTSKSVSIMTEINEGRSDNTSRVVENHK
jgi:deoxyribose-phosphate aldolase